MFVSNEITSNNVNDSQITGFGQSQDLILNDMMVDPVQKTRSVGIVTISQLEVNFAGGIILSSFFVYFIIATNVQDYNLFPSQAKLNQSTRQKIYELIEKNEGIHLREICRLLDKKMGVIQYHINVLEGANLVHSMKDGRYKRFFVNHQDAPEERVLISLLNRDTTAKVLLKIYENNGEGISHSTIAHQLKATSQAITWHIHKLEDAGILLTAKIGCQKVYHINPAYISSLESVLSNFS